MIEGTLRSIRPNQRLKCAGPRYWFFASQYLTVGTGSLALAFHAMMPL